MWSTRSWNSEGTSACFHLSLSRIKLPKNNNNSLNKIQISYVWLIRQIACRENKWFNICTILHLCKYLSSIKLGPKTSKTASILNQTEPNKLKKRMLFNKTRQYNIKIFNKIIFFKYRTRELKTTETNKLLILYGGLTNNIKMTW